MYSYHARQAPSSSKFWCTFCIFIDAIQPNPWIPASKFAGTNVLKLQRRKAIKYRGEDAMQFCVYPIQTNKSEAKSGLSSSTTGNANGTIYTCNEDLDATKITWPLLEHLALAIGWAGTFRWAFATWTEGVEFHEVQSTSHSICWLFSRWLLWIFFGSMYAQLNCSNEVKPGVAWAAKRWSQHCYSFGIVRAMSDEK